MFAGVTSTYGMSTRLLGTVLPPTRSTAASTPPLALPLGVLEHGDLEIAGLHGGEGLGGGVDAADEDRVEQVAGLQRVDRPERHLVVVRADDHAGLEGPGLDPVLGDGLALGAVPVTGLGCDDLHARVLADDVVAALGAEHGGLVGDLALQDDDVALAARELGELLHLHGAREQGVGADVGHVGDRRVAVDEHDRDVRGLGGVRHRLRGAGVDRHDDDRRDALRDEVLDLRQLGRGVVLGVGDRGGGALGGRLLLDGVLDPAQERVAVRERDAERDGAGRAGRGRAT